MPTLLIADDHPLFREALRGAVQRVIPGVQLFEADSVEALYALADQHNDADLVLMDLNIRLHSQVRRFGHHRPCPGRHPRW